ncbi:unnamed protein product [Leptosia nina]|uniref:Apolipoprotein D n=1 Tax=Leptosia nina TaxID=320188 RepID=A0AAV1J5Z0_9NEOP
MDISAPGLPTSNHPPHQTSEKPDYRRRHAPSRVLNYLQYFLYVKMSLLQSIVVFLVAYVTLNVVNAQVMIPGGCPDIKPLTNFEPARYLGKWYEAEKYFAIFELGGRCITATYTDNGNGVIGVYNKQVNSNGKKSGIVGEAKLTGDSNVAKLSVRFPSLPVDIPAPYWVIDTDYDNYALVWSCTDLGLMHTETSWILTRERNPPQSVIDTVYQAIEKNKIDKTHYIKTDQKNCPEDKE